MSETEESRFGAAEVIQIASKLTLDDAAFVIGGQATNLWAWFYQDKDPALAANQPLTSRDIDYFGSFSDVFNYLRTDQFGRRAKQELGIEALDILRKFQDDERIDDRYRRQNLAKMIEQIEERDRKLGF